MSTPTRKANTTHEGAYKIYHQGFLLRVSPTAVRKRLHRFWFVLFEQKDLLAFLFYEDEDHFLERKKNQGFFRIDDAKSIDVLPEYMGRKNAFCITTPRNKYYLVSESRYELHRWLVSLDDAVKQFKARNNTEQKKKKDGSRPRSSSTSGGGYSTKTPPRIKPSRPAPPVPQGKKKGINIDSLAINNNSGGQDENIEPTSLSQGHEQEFVTSPTTSPLDAIVAGLLAESKEMKTLEYHMTEEEPMLHHDEHMHQTNLINGNSEFTSLPVIPVGNTGGGGSRTPSDHNSEEGNEMTHHQNLSESYEELRHHSTTIPLDGRSKKKKRASIKGPRSVSPPTIPPPPPPDNEQQQQQVINPLKQLSEALNEITSEINNTTPTPPVQEEQPIKNIKLRPDPPKRVSSLSPKKDDASVRIYLEEAFQKEDNRQFSSPETPEDDEVIITKNFSVRLSADEVVEKKKTVMFQEEQRESPTYEPRIDHEVTSDDVPFSVVDAKKKLKQETEIVRFRKSNMTRRVSNDETNSVKMATADELVQSIENVLARTSYMETPPEIKKSFIAVINDETDSVEAPPTVNAPAHYSSEVTEDDDKTPPTTGEGWTNSNGYSGSHFDSESQNPFYRSLV